MDDQTRAAGGQTPARTTAANGQGNGMAQGDNAEFVQKAAIGNLAEIQLGQLATERAQNADVKTFARMMVSEHTKALDELRQAASRSGAQLPQSLDEKHRDIQQRLSGLKGAEFDREYMETMVEAHAEMAEMLDDHTRQASRGMRDGGDGGSAGTAATSSTAGSSTAGGTDQWSQWASKTLPSVRTHLEQAKQIRQRL